MLRRSPALALPVVVACCAAPEAHDEPTSSRGQAIVNGTPSRAVNDAIVRIDIGSQGGFCTGTLLAPNLVLTARHCLSEMDESTECGTFTADVAASSLGVRLGVNAGASAAKGKQLFVERGQNSGCSHDIGLVLLDRDIPDAKTAPVRLGKLTVGEAAWTGGYGDDGRGQVTPGRYERGGLTIDAVGPAQYTYKTKQNQSLPVAVPAGEIVTGESTCFGDSGGPLFDAKGNVIGVTSRGVDQSCVDRPSIYSDTASHVALVRAAAQASGHAIVEADAPGPSATPPGPGDASTPGTPSEDPAGDTADEPRPKKKKAIAVDNAGCQASVGRVAADATWLVVLAGAALLAARRRTGRA